jgi:hypothetical protein
MVDGDSVEDGVKIPLSGVERKINRILETKIVVVEVLYFVKISVFLAR